MMPKRGLLHRRRFIGAGTMAAAVLATPGLFAEQLQHTVAMTEGPFYPDRLPLDTDNDLLVIGDAITPAVGEITYLSGRVLSPSGSPVRNALVEIWQTDHRGAYLHTRSMNGDKRDGNFQGYGRFLTDSQGRYFFRTIKPVPYPGRTPHIHVAVSRGSHRLLTTQLLIKGHPQNETDGLFRRITEPQLRETVLVDFQPLAESKLGELSARFEIVLGTTPSDALPS